MERSLLHGSRREHSAAVDAAEKRRRIAVDLHLRDPEAPQHAPGSAADLARLAVRVTREDLAAQRKTQYEQAARLARRFAAEHGLKVEHVDFAKRRMRLSGTPLQFGRAFATEVATFAQGDHRFRSHQGPLHIADDLRPWIRGVLGLDNQKMLRPFVPVHAAADSAAALWPHEIARLYGIAAPRGGAGQCIAIIAPRGGYLAADLAAAAQGGVIFPPVLEVSVDNGRNKFGGGTIDDQEVALDLQVAGAVAPNAKLVVYFTDDSEQGLADAVLAAVHDTVNRPSVISISWGTSEFEWQPHPLDVINGALADAVHLGVIVTAAAGDMLATNAVGDEQVHVNFPASSPYVLSCGGTKITLNAVRDAIADEKIWNDTTRGTGGGVSELFDVPDYQTAVDVPPSFSTDKRGRGVPDVAAAAAFDSGYRIVVNGQRLVQGGTSAVAPLWAGLVALINAERAAPLKFLNPELYADPALCRRITQGNNMAGPFGYRARDGWSACGGLGVPIGAELLRKFTAAA
jgi:kumamolisin